MLLEKKVVEMFRSEFQKKEEKKGCPKGGRSWLEEFCFEFASTVCP